VGQVFLKLIQKRMKNNSAPLNPWAFVAIVCSVGMCPFFTIAGVLLGIRAIVDIKARPGTRGIRLAWAAIFIGGLVTGLWGGGMLWWNINVRGQMQQGPVRAIIEGQHDSLTFLKPSKSPAGSSKNLAKKFLNFSRKLIIADKDFIKYLMTQIFWQK